MTAGLRMLVWILDAVLDATASKIPSSTLATRLRVCQDLRRTAELYALILDLKNLACIVIV